MQLIYPERRAISPEELAAGLRLHELAPPARPYLGLNMVSSLDGKATLDWRTKGLSTEVDRRGVHVANIEGMRRAVAGLPMRPGYVLSDGFRVPGLPMPSLPVVGGDAAAVALTARFPARRIGLPAHRPLVEDHPLRVGRVELGDRVVDGEGGTRPEHPADVEHRGPFLV